MLTQQLIYSTSINSSTSNTNMSAPTEHEATNADEGDQKHAASPSMAGDAAIDIPGIGRVGMADYLPHPVNDTIATDIFRKWRSKDLSTPLSSTPLHSLTPLSNDGVFRRRRLPPQPALLRVPREAPGHRHRLHDVLPRLPPHVPSERAAAPAGVALPDMCGYAVGHGAAKYERKPRRGQLGLRTFQAEKEGQNGLICPVMLYMCVCVCVCVCVITKRNVPLPLCKSSPRGTSGNIIKTALGTSGTCESARRTCKTGTAAGS